MAHRIFEMAGETAVAIAKLQRGVAWQAIASSDVEIADTLLGLAHQLRKECRGQAPGIPDLRRFRITTPESVLAFEILPEMARRLYDAHGIEFVDPDQDLSPRLTSHYSAPELRMAAGECFKRCNFIDAAGDVRTKLAGAIEPGRLLALEIVSSALGRGNLIEIAASRISPPLSPSSQFFAEDHFALEIWRASRNRKLEPPHLSWSIDMDDGRGFRAPRHEPSFIDIQDAPFVHVDQIEDIQEEAQYRHVEEEVDADLHPSF